MAARPYRLILGRCEQVLPTLPENSFDSISCDPPYHLGDPRPMTRAYPQRDAEGVWDDAGRKKAERSGGFMGMKWDGGDIAFDPEMWRAALRVLKPGGYMVAFGGTRTYHRVACAIEDAGFILRDSIHWLYGSGFPKNLDIAKELAKANIDPALIARWQGFGTALKPAHEPIILAQKPLDGTYRNNVMKWGVGALNIGGSRVATADNLNGGAYASAGGDRYDGYENWRFKRTGGAGEYEQPEGRWPANVILTHAIDCTAELCAGDCPIGLLDAQVGLRKSGTGAITRKTQVGYNPNTYGAESRPEGTPHVSYADEGGVSRYYTITRWEHEDDVVPFLYAAKAARSERELGLDHLATKTPGEATMRKDGQKGLENPRAGAGRTSGARNFHPCVKPISLMRWLCRLITPPGGKILDHFAGSGTTLAAGVAEGFHVTGIEMMPEYLPLIGGRAEYYARKRASE